jgi:uncharacterized protein
MKIGVLADTHIPDRKRALPPRVLEIFAPVEIVLHAGDITSMQVLQQLEDRVSLTFAVYGDRDPMPVRGFLQETQVLEFAGSRIGLVHGHRDARWEATTRLRTLLRASPYTPEYLDYLISRFPNVDAIVFGHTHQPYARVHNGVFFFNPGSLVPANGTPSVGLLEIDTRGISGRILAL